jgi:hypothetical protein
MHLPLHRIPRLAFAKVLDSISYGETEGETKAAHVSDMPSASNTQSKLACSKKKNANSATMYTQCSALWRKWQFPLYFNLYVPFLAHSLHFFLLCRVFFLRLDCLTNIENERNI